MCYYTTSTFIINHIYFYFFCWYQNVVYFNVGAFIFVQLYLCVLFIFANRLQMSGEWKCGNCVFTNQSSAKICIMCKEVRKKKVPLKPKKDRKKKVPLQPNISDSTPSFYIYCMKCNQHLKVPKFGKFIQIDLYTTVNIL